MTSAPRAYESAHQTAGMLQLHCARRTPARFTSIAILLHQVLQFLKSHRCRYRKVFVAVNVLRQPHTALHLFRIQRIGDELCPLVQQSTSSTADGAMWLNSSRIELFFGSQPIRQNLRPIYEKAAETCAAVVDLPMRPCRRTLSSSSLTLLLATFFPCIVSYTQ